MLETNKKNCRNVQVYSQKTDNCFSRKIQLKNFPQKTHFPFYFKYFYYCIQTAIGLFVLEMLRNKKIGFIRCHKTNSLQLLIPKCIFLENHRKNLFGARLFL